MSKFEIAASACRVKTRKLSFGHVAMQKIASTPLTSPKLIAYSLGFFYERNGLPVIARATRHAHSSTGSLEMGEICRHGGYGEGRRH